MRSEMDSHRIDAKDLRFWLRWLLPIAVACILPLFLNHSWLSVLIEVGIMALVGSSLNLLFGYAGMVSFGHAGLFTFGAYTVAILLHYNYAPFYIACILAPLATSLFSIIVGWFCVKRVEVYFALLVLAFAQIVYMVAYFWVDFTGGSEGLTMLPVAHFFESPTSVYYLTVWTVGICLFVLYAIGESPFGYALRAIRENRERSEFIGINRKRYILLAFIISGFFSGIGGTLMVIHERAAFPGYAHFMKNAEFLLVCLLGGMNSFIGSTVGSFFYVISDTMLTRYTEHWPIILGGTIVFITLFFRGGIMGFLEKRYDLFKRRREELK